MQLKQTAGWILSEGVFCLKGTKQQVERRMDHGVSTEAGCLNLEHTAEVNFEGPSHIELELLRDYPCNNLENTKRQATVALSSILGRHGMRSAVKLDGAYSDTWVPRPNGYAAHFPDSGGQVGPCRRSLR